MGSNLVQKVSHIIEIDDDVIELDGENTPEEVIYEWDAKIRKKLSMFAVADNENVLGDLMKEYLQSLQEIARNYEDNETLKNKVYCHISFLYSYYVELQCCTPDNYLSNMEDILSLYCNLELEVIRPFKKKDFSKHIYKKRIVSVSRRIIYLLTVYLLERHDHILHVLIKMNISNVTESCSEVLNILYSHFLTKVPASSSCDESFCRSYILFQKWKQVRKSEDWEGMDKIMYKMFKRTPESIKNNDTLRQILMPACNSTVDIVFNLFRSFRDISSAYFKHVLAKKNTELDDLDFNIDLGEDEPTISVDDENEEEVTFLKAYYEVERNMSNLSNTANTSEITEVDIFRKCKQEFDEDDDVQFVGVTMLEQPPQRSIDLVIDYGESDEKVINAEENQRVEEERIPVPTPPALLNPTRQKDPDLENLNGIIRIRSDSPKPVAESSTSSHSIEVQTALQPSSPVLCAIKEVINACDVFTETHQPKVSLASNDTQISSSSSPANISDSLSVNKRTKEMKSVEVQADNIKNYLYNDYGLTTPPFDVSTDEQISRPLEPRLYTDIGQNRKKESEKIVVEMRSVEVQVDPVSSNSSKECPYNDYGLTPPTDTHLDDHPSRLQETCLYTNIGQKDLSEGKPNFESDSRDVAHSDEVPQLAQDNTETETSSRDAEMRKDSECENIEHESEYDEFDDHLDVPNVTHIDAECDTEDMDLESCHETDRDSPLRQDDSSNPMPPEENHDDRLEFKNTEEESDQSFKTSDKIDTGQKVILNTAPNIESESEAPTIEPESTHTGETKDLPEPFNGNTVLKPLVSSNRTNGQAKDVNTPSKIMYTSSQKIKTISLDDFSRFESAIHTAQWSKMKENHDFEDILSGPVSKVMPTKHTNLLSQQEKLDIFGGQEPNSKPMTNASSRSNSPNEMTSPAYEAIDDFRNYFSDSVNGRVPPPHDIKVPQSILKKSNSTRRKNYRIMFHESTCDNYEERRPRSDGVLVPKRVRRDRKLNMEPRVVVERLSFIESKMKKVLNNPPTLRVDYDKTTTHINEKDVVRCISPPRFSWILSTTSSRNNPGSVTVKNRDHLEKKPKKRKFETPNVGIGEPIIRKRGRPRKNL